MKYKLLDIVRSERPGKKWTAHFKNTDTGRMKSTHFGASGMDDFTISKDEEQAKRYRTRHAKDLDTNDPTRAGFLSYYILWASPDLRKNIRDYKKRFDL
jgi:TPR repeat protein